MLVGSSSTSDSECACRCRHGLHHAGPLCPRSRHLHRLRRLDADSHNKNRVKLLRCSTPNPKHPSVSHQARAAVARRVAGSDTAGLRQCDSRRSAPTAPRSTSVSHERSGSTRLRRQKIRPCHSATARPSLVVRPGTNRLPSGCVGLSLPAWSRSRVSVG